MTAAPRPDPPPDGPVLLTGATGFVGSHVAALLAGGGTSLRCTVRATSDLSPLAGLEVELREADLAAGEGVAAAVAGCRAVVHVAGLTRAADPEAYRRVNVEGTRRLAAASVEAGVRRFVLLSSLAARGPDGADRPVSDYGRSKRAAEIVVAEVAAAGGLETAVLRPPAVYGPRDVDLLPLFRIAGHGWIPAPRTSPRLQAVYAADLARAVAAALEAEAPAAPLAVAEAETYSWDEVAAALGRAVGREVRPLRLPAAAFTAAAVLAEAASRLTGRPPAFDRRRALDLARREWTCSVEEASRSLGWRARVSLPEGLARTAAWYRKAGWLR